MTAFFTPPEIHHGTKTVLAIAATDFLDAQRSWRADDNSLLIAVDTEYKTPDAPVSMLEIKAQQAKYKVLSYQFAARMPTGEEWEGIHCPQELDERISFADFIVMVLAIGKTTFPHLKYPRELIVCGHFMRADFSAFSDFNSNIRGYLNNIRSTFLSLDSHAPIEIEWSETSKVKLEVKFRDTMVLAPSAAKKLADIGEMIGLAKLTLDDDASVHKHMIRNMDQVRRENWPKFREYALRDAQVALKYAVHMMDTYESLFSKRLLPVTLTSIGVDFLRDHLSKANLNPLRVFGKEEITEHRWDNSSGRKRKFKRLVFLPEVHMYEQFASECYHGGRNEQIWFGPGYAADWTDYDISSAYATAMSLLGLPDWENIRVENDDVDAFQPDVLGLAWVEFEFPEEARFPCLPQRTANGLIFPRRGRSYCAAPEIWLANKMGAKITIKRGLIVPMNRDVRIFGDFIKECLARRRENKKNKLLDAFWKEIGNSTYGKLAQGLLEKRVYSMRDDDMLTLPPSRITNPFLAAFVTSFVRALLGEILNSLPSEVCVFSDTTDGFLSDATPEQIAAAQQGKLSQLFIGARSELNGETLPALEAKHRIRRPLGWRTRGQATLEPDKAGSEIPSTLLAKAGIYTDEALEKIEDKNQDIVDKFFTRTPQSVVLVKSYVGLRQMLEFQTDFVEKEFIRRLSMEYDWKRRPMSVGWSNDWRHVFFNTEPWETVQQFDRVRELWDEYRLEEFEDANGKVRKMQPCVKTVQDFLGFAEYVATKTHVKQEDSAYLSRRGDGDIKRLRQQVCAAWRNAEAGFTEADRDMSQPELVAILQACSIPCTTADVKYSYGKRFNPGSVPATDRVLELLGRLQVRFPAIQPDRFYTYDTSAIRVTFGTSASGPFMDRVT